MTEVLRFSDIIVLFFKTDSDTRETHGHHRARRPCSTAQVLTAGNSSASCHTVFGNARPECTLNALRPEVVRRVNDRFPGAVEWLQQQWAQPVVMAPEVIAITQAVFPQGVALLQEWRGDLTPVWGPLLVEPTTEKGEVVGKFPLQLVFPGIIESMRSGLGLNEY